MAKRGLTEETCRKFGYGIATHNGKTVQVAPYFADGKVVAQKVRGRNKDFYVLGKLKDAGLFGQQLWEGYKTKRLIITEGEIDCLSVSQIQSNKWPVVSVPNGAQGAKKSIAAQLDFVLQFEQIIICFDQDDPGHDAAKEVARMLPPGRAKIVSLPLKDPNEMLQAGRAGELSDALWNAVEYRPDGLVTVADIMDEIQKPIEQGLPWFLERLTKLTHGRRLGEIYGFGAGTGVGKTDLFTEQMAYDITKLNERIGVIMLEQKPVETSKRLAGKIASKRFHVPDAGWTAEELKEASGKLEDKAIFYDNFGQAEWDVVKGHIRYMAAAFNIRLFYLDHLTALADSEREKESLEKIMKEMAGLADELNIVVHFVSHLTTPEGKPHEEGGRVTIRQFKGSRAIGFWSFFMFGLERNQQAQDEAERSVTVFRVLKDRYTGQATGEVIYLGYNAETGRLIELEGPPEEGGRGHFPDGDDDDDDDDLPF